ncbi:MAG: TatD family hydrolase [Bacillota bacterium]
MNLLADSHAHLNAREFSRDLDEVIMRASRDNVRVIINVGIDLKSSALAVRQAERYSGVWATAGIHPHYARSFNEDARVELWALLSSPKVCAVGETGMDLYRNLSPREDQERAFVNHLELASRANLPVVIHIRDAYEETLRVLETDPPRAGGVLHCFSGDVSHARKALDLGLYISFAGTITYSRNSTLAAAAAYVPADRILIETDCPYLTPVPFRGKRNEPAFVSYVAERLAIIRRVSPVQLAEIVYENTVKLFGITEAAV